MKVSRVPDLCLVKLRALGVDTHQLQLQQLAEHCSSLDFAVLSEPWSFVPDVSIAVPDERDAQLLEKQLMSWALSPDKSTHWLQFPVHTSVEPQLVSADFEWRDVQIEMSRKLQAKRQGAIALFEGGTGIGKTRVTAQYIANLLECNDGPVLVAVPTVMLVRQWIEELAEIDPNLPVQPVLGSKHYDNPKDQLLALKSASTASLVICTQHMLLQVLMLQRWSLVVDEAHLLFFAIAATAGKFMPVAVMGAKFEAWCRNNLGMQEGVAQEVMLKGRMRRAVIERAGLDFDMASSVEVFAVVQAEGAMGVALRDAGAAEHALMSIWNQCTNALLLSATLSTRTGAGVRSTRVFSERLCIPHDRLQDLGQIKASWRDANVVVRVPERAKGTDGGVWLSPHAKRKDQWIEEVVCVLGQWRFGQKPKKTLLLSTSYADVEAIALACKELRIPGVIASERRVEMRELQLAFDTSQVWLWIATGSAWTGMDVQTTISRLAVARLPLQNPDDTESVDSIEQVRFDCVNRFRQGVGRMVRGDSSSEPRELVLLDGRINERSAWWRSVVQPYMQVLAEDYEVHQVFNDGLDGVSWQKDMFSGAG